MYCGDETGGIVIDVGGANARFGYAGSDMPTAVFPSTVGVVDEPIPASGGGGSSSMGIGAGASSAIDATIRRKYRIDQAARLPRSGMDMRSPLDMGLVEDFDMLEAVWRHGYGALNVGNARDHPVLLAEAIFSHAAQREKQAEILFETFGVPAVYFAKAPVLQAFALGRTSALVADIGATSTRVAPVVDGHCLHRGQMLSEVGGQALTAALSDVIAKSGQLPDRTIWPRTLIKKVPKGSSSSSSSSLVAAQNADGGSTNMDIGVASGSTPRPVSAGATSSSSSSSSRGAGVGSSSSNGGGSSFIRGNWEVIRRTDVDFTPSYHATMMAEVVDDCKRTVCEVAEIGYDEKRPPSEKAYELPDGTVITLGSARQIVSELHFRHEAMERFSGLLKARVSTAWHAHHAAGALLRASVPVLNAQGEATGAFSQSPLTLQGMIRDSLAQCHVEIRRDLCNHILVTGGGSLLSGLPTRLKWETMAAIPAAFKPRILEAAPVERMYGAWIGGSILSSLGTFQQMWVSRQEWEEEGGGALERKCQ